MKDFVTAVEDVYEDEEREAKIAVLMEKGKSREDAEREVDSDEKYIPFKVDGRELHAYQPTPGQLAFMLASLGRGQSADQRFAAIINVMLASLRDADADYLESRLLTRDPKKRLPIKQVEEIFSYLTEEWFRADTPGGSEAV